MSSPRRLILTALILVGIAAALWFHFSPTPPAAPTGSSTNTKLPPVPPSPKPPADDADYVGSATCTNCHADIARRYEQHPMAHAADLNRPAANSFVSADKPVQFRSGPFQYEVRISGDKIIHAEQLLDKNGKALTNQEAVVGYTLGSGVRGKSYLIDRGGLLYQSPISWYTQEQKWDLSPGYSLDLSETRFERRVTDDCLSCHAGRMALADHDTADRFQEQPFIEPGIGCERCHGPGRQHVERFESGPVPKDADRLIVNPKSLDAWRRDSVCYQCHFSAKRVLRHGRRHYDFRPGQPLDEIWTILVHADDTAEGTPDKAVSHVQEMYSSKCYLGSEGRFTCTSCHDPHGVPSASERVEFFNQRCSTCHSDRGCSAPDSERLAEPAAGSCIACHMPRRAAGDIVHTSQTDHRLQRKPAPLQDHQVDDSALVIFQKMGEGLQEWEILRAKGLAAAEEAYLFRRQDNRKLLAAADILLKAYELEPGDARIIQGLGAVYYLANKEDESRKWFELALRFNPNDEESLKMLGIACFRGGDFAQGLKHLKKAMEVNPWNAEVYARYAVMAAVFNDFPEAIQAANKGLELSPTLVPLREDLVKFLDQSGRSKDAATQRNLLIKIQRELDSAP